MESREGMNSGVTVIAPGAPSNYHVAPRTENSTKNAIPVTETPPPPPPPPPPSAVAVASQVSIALTGSTEKKKRGRPRKYDGASPNARTLSPMPLSAAAPPASGNYFGDKSIVPRPLSSEKKQKQKIGSENLGDWVSCSTGGSFLPHMISVNAGEDVSMKIISFSQQGPRAICVISAVGVISNVTLRQPNSSGGTLTYEGRFEILSLSGSFTPTEFGARNRTGGMSVSLASPDGRVVGGVLAGVLIAAAPVQVVVGSFLPGNHQEVKPKKQKPEAKVVSHPTSYPAITYHSSNPEQQMSSNNQGLNNTAVRNPPHLVSSSIHPQNGAHASPIDDSRRSATDINISLQRD